MILICFPWAGGTSALYSAWPKHPALSSTFDSIVMIDYPGRATKFNQEPIDHISPLVENIMMHDCFNEQAQEEIVLFGHSFGAIVAFEVARRLEARGQSPKAVYVSASVPPSKSPLVETSVSKLSVDGIRDYFASKGNPVQEVVLNTPEFLDMFVRNVRADYKCLETYVGNSLKIEAPLFVIGGGLDPGVTAEDLEGWKKHVGTPKITAETPEVHVKVYDDQGHFYLSNAGVMSDLGDFIVKTVAATYAKEELEKKATIKEHAIAAFHKALGLPQDTEIPPKAHFFNELGGTSLDTMVLTAYLQGTLGLRITQDEFILHPTLDTLVERVLELQMHSLNVPKLDPIEPKKEEEWHPASAGQEQMVALWESAPTMYNMPTTIEFHDNLVAGTMKQAMEHVAKQQEGLRTVVCFNMDENTVMQKILPVEKASECFSLVELKAANDEEARMIIEKESGFVFDLAKPPIFRGVIVKTPSTHLLLLNQHHVGADGWSRTQYRRQILKAYLALKQGHPVDTIPKHPTYLDWTIYTRRLLYDNGQKKKQLEYWKCKLADLQVLDLPLDHMRPLVLSSRGARIPVEISADLTSKFKVLMAKANSNLFVGLLSLYMSLLHVWGGGDKFSIGVAMANRQHEGLADLVGYFANEVPILADFRDDPSFIGFLGQIRQNVLGAMANSDVPFHEVCEALKVIRDSGRTSVFQAMFALQEREWHSVDDLSPKQGENDGSFELKQFNHNTSKFEVHLQLRHDGQGGLEGDFHIATDLFTLATGTRLVEALKLLMEGCIDNPYAPIAKHIILPKTDLNIINESNSTNLKFDNTSLWNKIESVNGDATAFKIHGDMIKEVSYNDFRRNSMDVAGFLNTLKECGADASLQGTQRIGVLVKNSAEGIMMIMGTYLAHMTSVIVDVEKTPTERITMIFKDAGVKHVLVLEKYDEVTKALDGTFSIFHWSEILEGGKRSAVTINAPTNVNHPFAIYYTSGTTGLPKGVMIELCNIMNLQNWWVEYFEIAPEDRCMLFSSLSFIMSIRQYIPPLTCGASVTIPKSAFEFESAIVKSQVNKLICTPSALAALDIDKVKTLDAIQVAGEPAQKLTMDLWMKKAKKVHIGLGPTELCAHAMCGLYDGQTLCIGKPAANVRAYVVNRYGNQCPLNCIGELWIAGANVSSGYLNRDAENKKHFSIDPFNRDGSRLYKTGDLCRRLADGRIQFIGRRDKQIKLNGYRIEIGDIQGAMGPSVKNSFIRIEKGQLVAYVMPKVNISEVKTNLEGKLPTYMVPSHIIAVEDFPLNKNRKVDTDALSQLRDLDLSDPVQVEEVETRAEKIVKMVWSEVLGVCSEELKQNDNFFSIGGTSLTAVILSRKLGKELSTDVSVHDVFRYQTILSFSEHIQSASGRLIHGMPDPLTFLNGGCTVMNRYMFGFLQLLGLILMTFLVAVPLLATTSISVRSFLWFGLPGILLFPTFVVVGCLVHMVLVLICKWAIMGRFKPGKAKVFSWLFLKWWLVRRLIHVSSLYTWIFDETPISSLWLKLLGASVGKNCSIEQPYILEPDLVTIGSDCVLEFETQLSTSEINKGIIEFRNVTIGNNVKLGVRSVLLGGTTVAEGCEVLPKSALDFYTTSSKNQVIGGSPATVVGSVSAKTWRLKQGPCFMCFQVIGVVAILFLMSFIAFIGVTIGIVLQEKYGSAALIAYLGALFSTMSSIMFLLLVAVIYRLLLPSLEPQKVYSSPFFLLRKWFMDRLFLSPMFRYASERTLQTSSTFPWYLKLLGAKAGEKAWMNHPYIRVGVNFVEIGSEVHMGMLSYLTTERVDQNGVSFWPISIGDHASFGQRCVVLSGSSLGKNVTIGAETLIPHDFILTGGGTTFGSPPVQFHSSLSHKERVQQTQNASERVLASAKRRSTLQRAQSLDVLPRHSEENDTQSSTHKMGRRQDVGKEMFWTYVFLMLTLQALIPIAMGGSYVLIYLGAKLIITDLNFQHLILISPILYLLGSFVLMFLLKGMQSLGGGFSVGTARFFSFKFLYWHLLADMIYFCTSTVLYPMSGTQIYCMWLRFMGAKIGKDVFISPENGGFREIDFMNIGDNCVLMTPNIHAHYTDHGQLQFCSIILEDKVEINFGSTIMPLTQYKEGCRLRPHAVTVKGQICDNGIAYFGNPCKVDAALTSFEYAAILFPGQGSQYPGLMDKLSHMPHVQEMLSVANEVLGWELLERCNLNAEDIDNTINAQPIMFLAGLAHVELMKQIHPTMFSKVKAVAGFSLGEITALCYAGAISFVDALKLVKVRAEVMSKYNGGAMCNIRELSLVDVKSLCRKTGCTIANIICNHEEKELEKFNIFVCAGSSKEVSLLVSTVEEMESGKSKKLRVSGAFHSKHMIMAKRALIDTFNSINISLPTDKLIYSNVTGRPYRSVNEIRQNLKKHLVSPVLWHDTIQSMIKEEDIVAFVECGPMDVLSKTVQAIVKGQLDEECQHTFKIFSSDK